MQRKIRRQIQRRLRQKAAQVLWTSIAAAGLIFGACGYVMANPTGGTVTSGSAEINGSGTSTMTINQTTDTVSIDWTGFSIDYGESVTFVQPDSSSIAVNRVTGTDASLIYGTLTANGQIYLINPNGILFSSTAQVNVGGIVASTLALDDDDFKEGNYTFSGSGGSVVNQGTITASDGGYVALLGNTVSNIGTITADSGTVVLGAGSQITLDFDGDSLLGLTVDSAVVDAMVENGGVIQADGGTVLLTAAAANTVAGAVVNNYGMIRAQSIANVNGTIVLDGGTNGAVINSGTLDASGTASGATGGTVKVLGETVTLADGTMIDVSGDAGGGTVLIGGNYQGSGAEQHATTTTVAVGATINADAITMGDGGSVVVWSDENTSFAGTISANGGTESGDGGSVETSSEGSLQVADTASVITTAANGATGEWLLDPADFTIGGTDGDISVATLEQALETTNVTITTGETSATATTDSATLASNTDSSGDGDITVAEAIAWDSDYALTLVAVNDINVNAAITATGDASGLVLSAGNDININANITLSGDSASLSLDYGDSGSYSLNNGASITLSGDDPNLSIAGEDYEVINTVAELQSLSSTTFTTGSRYALGVDLDLSSGTSFTSIGSSSSAFMGIFDGLGHTISNLTVSSSSDCVGLFGYASGTGTTIRNLGLIDPTVSGANYVGALLGYGTAACTIENCYVTDTDGSTAQVTGSASVGGLAGGFKGTISNCYSTIDVSGTANVGGLVGYYTTGTISDCYATGDVTGTGNYVGGLVGYTTGTISDCYATGDVTGTGNYVGGLVGYTTETISDCYATGDVTGTGSYVGGLTGCMWGSSTANCYVTECYATGDVTGTGNYIGGLAGFSYYGVLSSCYSSGTVNGSTASYVGGLVGRNYTSAITNCYSTSSVTGAEYVGGLVGYNCNSAVITNCYATGTVSGSGADVGGLVGFNNGSSTVANCFWNIDNYSGNGIGYDNNSSATTNVVGLTSEQMTDVTYYSACGWDIADDGDSDSVWRIYDGYSLPLLRSFLTKLTVAADAVSKEWDGTAYTAALTGVTYTTEDGMTTDDAPDLVSGSLTYGTSKTAGTYYLSGLYCTSQNGCDISYDSSSTLTITGGVAEITGGNTYIGALACAFEANDVLALADDAKLDLSTSDQGVNTDNIEILETL